MLGGVLLAHGFQFCERLVEPEKLPLDLIAELRDGVLWTTMHHVFYSQCRKSLISLERQKT